MRTKIDCCTKDCPDRRADPNCHSYCEKYLQQRAELDETNKAMFQRKNVDEGITSTLVHSIEKVSGHKNKKGQRNGRFHAQ